MTSVQVQVKYLRHNRLCRQRVQRGTVDSQGSELDTEIASELNTG